MRPEQELISHLSAAILAAWVDVVVVMIRIQDSHVGEVGQEPRSMQKDV